MIDEAEDEWLSILPQDLLQRAYRASNEQAWSRSDAIEVVRILQTNGYHILGVDTWLPTRPGPSPLIDDWDERRGGSAIDFIKTFTCIPVGPKNVRMQPYFNITVD